MRTMTEGILAFDTALGPCAVRWTDMGLASVRLPSPRTAALPHVPGDGDLVPEHQDLDVLGRVGSGEQRQPAQHAGEHQVRESKGHGARSCWAACEP